MKTQLCLQKLSLSSVFGFRIRRLFPMEGKESQHVYVFKKGSRSTKINTLYYFACHTYSGTKSVIAMQIIRGSGLLGDLPMFECIQLLWELSISHVEVQ